MGKPLGACKMSKIIGDQQDYILIFTGSGSYYQLGQFYNQNLNGGSASDVIVGDVSNIDYQIKGLDFAPDNSWLALHVTPDLYFGDDIINGGNGNNFIYGDVINFNIDTEG